MKYYLSADWIIRSDQLKDDFDGIALEEECEYSFAVLEDFFYEMHKNPDFIFYQDQEIAGRKLETKIEKDKDGKSFISWTRTGKRYYIEFESIENFEEFQGAFPEFSISFPEEMSLGMPAPDFEDSRMITLHLPPDICPDCGGIMGECDEDEEND